MTTTHAPTRESGTRGRRHPAPHRIVIVGGGAGGLELATRLGRRHGGAGRFQVTLVDRTRTHMWKPLLHAVAAGSLNIHAEQADYLDQARWNRFEYCRGPITGLDRAARELVVARCAAATARWAA